MSKRTFLRITTDLALLLCVLEGWWIPAIVIGVLGLWYFSFYVFDFLVAGILFDSLFGIVSKLAWVSYAGTILSLMLAELVQTVKKLVRK
ncbi:MAG: hypothetical protein WCT02_00905 [Candidatus Paceibacterota bacterium]|jgi:hypothetical protein